MKKDLLLWLAVVFLALGLVSQYFIYSAAPSGGFGEATWDFQPRTFAEVVNKAPVAVQAQVVAVEAGPDIVVSAPSEPGGKDVIPTQNIRMRVLVNEKAGKGASVNAGQEIVVFHTGGQSNIPASPAGGPDAQRDKANTQRVPPPAGGKPGPNAVAPQLPAAPHDANTPAEATNARIFVLGDDPAYAVGDKYFLFLEPGPNNTMRPVSPEGRYNISSGRAQPVIDTPVALGAAGRLPADLGKAARGEMTIANVEASKRQSTDIPGMPTTGLPEQSWLVLIFAALICLVSGLVLRWRRQS